MRLCNYCRKELSQPLYIVGVCLNCLRCVSCDRAGVVADPDGMFRQQLCDMCRCSMCKGQGKARYTPDGEKRVRMCNSCYGKKYGSDLCKSCHTNARAVLLKGHTKPSICVACVRPALPNGHRGVHYCFFCNEKAVAASGKWVVCAKHQLVKYCLTEGCSPGTPCKRCQTRAAEDTRIIALRNTLVLTEYEHEREGDECYTNCRACGQIEAQPIEFKAAEIVFWPRSDTPNPALPMSRKRLNRSSRYLSAEIEVAGLNNPRRKDLLVAVVKKWGGQIVHDGSLPHGGFEINTSPAAGDFFVEQISEICTALRDAEAYVTNACGTHVHADARDLTYPDIRRLFLYYEKVEAAFQQMQPYQRGLNNQYCRPVGKQLADAVRTATLPEFFKKSKGATKPIKTAVFGSIYPGYGVTRPPRGNHYGREYGEPHYDALNAHSWVFRGTLENRYLGGTVVARKIVDWATLWGAFIDRSLTISEANIIGITPREEIMRIAPTKRVQAFIEARLTSYKDEYKAKGIAI